MKTVKLSCPRCQAENHYAVADLQAANGRVQCSQCRHAFTVARKPKAQSAPAAQAEILQEDVIHAKMPLREKLARLKQQSAALAAQQAGQDADESLHTQKKPLAAELDEIDSRLRRQRMALDNDTGQAMPFKLAEAERTANSADAIEALLQRSASTPPPPTVLPSIDTLLKSAQSAAAGHGQTQNIHIQAESLVFNCPAATPAAFSCLLRPNCLPLSTSPPITCSLRLPAPRILPHLPPPYTANSTGRWLRWPRSRY